MVRVIVVVMGVSGSGKTTIGTQLARRIGLPFVEADEYHDAAALAAMSQGRGLTDADRAPWLDRVNAALRDEADDGAVCACSALDEWARHRLTRGLDDVRFVWLHGDPQLVAARLRARRHHPVGVSLLPSQMAALEPPAPSPRTLSVDVDATPDQIVDQVVEWLGVESKHS